MALRRVSLLTSGYFCMLYKYVDLIFFFLISSGGSYNVHTIDSPCTNLRPAYSTCWVYHSVNGEERRCNCCSEKQYFISNRALRVSCLLALTFNGIHGDTFAIIGVIIQGSSRIFGFLSSTLSRKKILGFHNMGCFSVAFGGLQPIVHPDLTTGRFPFAFGWWGVWLWMPGIPIRRGKVLLRAVFVMGCVRSGYIFGSCWVLRVHCDVCLTYHVWLG
jgi:hypothetical protein